MKVKFLIALVCLGLSIADMTSAKIYKYYDESGNLCVTDDLSLVPESKRPSAKTVLEIKSTPNHHSQSESASDQSAYQSNKNLNLKNELEAEFKQLESVRRNLESKYYRLSERREILLFEKETAKTPEQLKQFNQKALELNQETIKYKKKREPFETGCCL